MTKALTYVEIDIPSFDSPPTTVTFRFAIDAKYLPSSITAIPSLIEVKIDPAKVSLGEDLGTRATVTCTFKDHRHRFTSFADIFDTGSFWGKFRARYGLTLFGKALRVIYGTLGQALADMETRYFIIESTDGPNEKGEYQIIAKDILKFADDDRAQAPVLSNGFLVADITNTDITATLSPAGIGNAEYPSSGMCAIGGSEICTFTRSGDTLTLTRGQRNTAAAAHSAQDRVQVVLQYLAQDPSSIIRDLLVNYAGVPSGYITLSNWQNEVSTFLSTVYTAYIAEPTGVRQLVSELIEQVGLVMWWDSINQQIKLQVLRPVPATADTFDATNTLQGSLSVKEQPEKRLTDVYTYFAKINPLVNDDQMNNYRSTSYVADTTGKAVYGSAAIKKIFSRWIPNGGRAIADSIGNVQISRFRDPPRRISLNILRGSVDMPLLGTGYQIGGYPFQKSDGSPALVGAQITSLNPRADIFEIEAEEISTTFTGGGGGGSSPGGGGTSPADHQIIIDSNLNNVNLRTMHDSLFTPATAGTSVTCTINAGVVVGSTSTLTSAFNAGTWAAGVAVNVINRGRIEGKGGAGGTAIGTATTLQPGNGSPGGNALHVIFAITLDNSAGQIWSGGGGGGAGSSNFINPPEGSSGGGGGGGKQPGAGGSGISGGFGIAVADGSAGTQTAGGAGGNAGTGPQQFPGGAGGNPGSAGVGGSAGGVGLAAGTGGAAGAAIDGVSLVSFIGSHGNILGSQIN